MAAGAADCTTTTASMVAARISLCVTDAPGTELPAMSVPAEATLGQVQTLHLNGISGQKPV